MPPWTIVTVHPCADTPSPRQVTLLSEKTAEEAFASSYVSLPSKLLNPKSMPSVSVSESTGSPAEAVWLFAPLSDDGTV